MSPFVHNGHKFIGTDILLTSTSTHKIHPLNIIHKHTKGCTGTAQIVNFTSFSSCPPPYPPPPPPSKMQHKLLTREVGCTMRRRRRRKSSRTPTELKKNHPLRLTALACFSSFYHGLFKHCFRSS